MATLLAVLGVTVSASAAANEAAPAALPGHLVDRAESATTSRGSDGTFYTRVDPARSNYQTDSGMWRPVDRALKQATTGELRPAAADEDVSVPTSLHNALKVRNDGSEMRIRLLGAGGTRQLRDGAAVFEEAFAGVDAIYAATNEGLKETLVLKSRQTRGVFRYELRTADDSTAAVVGNEVVVADGAGSREFSVSAPIAWDSASDPAYSDNLLLEVTKETPGRWTVTMTADAAWLADTSRVYPVSLDPIFGAFTDNTDAADCTVRGAPFASTNFCAAPQMQLSAFGPAKALLKFDIDAAIPPSAVVDYAYIDVYAPGAPTTPAPPTASARLRTVTSPWSAAATWSLRSAGTSWAIPGGDVSADAALTGPASEIASAGQWYQWQAPTLTVQRWISGTLPNYGLQLSTDPGSPTGTTYQLYSRDGSVVEQRPSLMVVWTVPDTTPPTPPENLDISNLQPGGFADVGWREGDDPGTYASGVSHTEFRVKIGTGSFSSWSNPGYEYSLSGLSEGTALTLEARTVDDAGNYSTVVSLPHVAGVASDSVAENGHASQWLAAKYSMTPAQALEWLDVQRRFVPVARSTENTLGTTFAGSWFDNVTRKAHIGVTTASAGSTAQNSINAKGLNSWAIVDQRSFSQADLNSASDAASDLLQSYIIAGKVRISPDVQLGAVVFELSAVVDAALDGQISTIRSGTTVTTTLRRTSRLTLALAPASCEKKTLSSGDMGLGCSAGTYHAGAVITVFSPGTMGNQLCSTGFAALKGTEQRLTTVGHCFAGAKPGDADPGAQYVNASNNIVGGSAHQQVESGVSYHGEAHDDVVASDGRDVGMYRFKAAYARAFSPFVAVRANTAAGTTADENYPIMEVASPEEGQPVCATLGHSGVTRCGIVTHRRQRHQTAAIVQGLCVAKGDSGSPVYKDNTAYGYVSGFDSTLTGDDCITLIQGAKSLEVELGVKILTVERLIAWLKRDDPPGGPCGHACHG